WPLIVTCAPAVGSVTDDIDSTPVLAMLTNGVDPATTPPLAPAAISFVGDTGRYAAGIVKNAAAVADVAAIAPARNTMLLSALSRYRGVFPVAAHELEKPDMVCQDSGTELAGSCGSHPPAWVRNILEPPGVRITRSAEVVSAAIVHEWLASS